MRVGTKSLLFGVHQFLIHPVCVIRAWIALYRQWPSWKEIICIFVHDWGYLGKWTMDGADGERHPELGARIVRHLFGREYFYLCLLHSRHYARARHQQPSRLCWADKLSIAFLSPWLYLWLARRSGEIEEYHRLCVDGGFLPATSTQEEWYWWLRERFIRLAIEQKADAVPYFHGVSRRAQ